MLSMVCCIVQWVWFWQVHGVWLCEQDSDISVTETQTDTEMIDISKTDTETNTERFSILIQ